MDKKSSPFNIEVPAEISPEVLALSGVLSCCRHFTKDEIMSDPRLAKILGCRLDEPKEKSTQGIPKGKYRKSSQQKLR